MQDSKPSQTPMSMLPLPTLPTPEDIERMKSIPYRSAVCSLIHLSVNTRPDIALAVSVVSKYLDRPCWEHWIAVKRIYRYLNGTCNHGIVFSGKDTILRGFVDADWAGDTQARKSRSGYTIFLGNSLISWRSKLQTCTALSTAEAEYIAANHAGCEIIFLRSLFESFGFPQPTTTIFEDNQSCIHMSNNPVINDAGKHIQIKYHWIRDEINKASFSLVYCNTKDMIADTLTKPLDLHSFNKHCSSLGIKSWRSV